ncbi:hypothetical protein BG46_15815 [Brucella anthropi]|uniref:helix-turn-helix domain-containing protein n=1 Tax=Brucella anthropi TaxID=529 RepID=UPI000449DD66|nr:helix-turn-helix domain-containing protein [Brucella anthropi]EXL06238.1 hypothetical protein BG46_15815 [Brucella anthropi]
MTWVERLNEALAKKAWTKAELQRQSGVPYDNIVKYLGGKVDQPRGDTLPKLAQALGVDPLWLEKGISSSAPIIAKPSLTPIQQSVGSIPVTGKVAANTWLSVDDMDFGYDDIEYVPSASGYPVELQFALKVEGNCLNKIANHGDRLICLDIAKTGIETEDGDLVIVERSRFEGQMIERTAKRLRRTADGYELWPESTDPAHQEPIKLHRVDNGDHVRIIGKVLWIMRKP